MIKVAAIGGTGLLGSNLINLLITNYDAIGFSLAHSKNVSESLNNIIAHRLSTIRNVDRIYVLDSGRLIEQGMYKQLRNKKDSKFSSLIALQKL